MNGRVNDYEKLVSSIQKDATVLRIDLYDQAGYYGLYQNGKIYIEKTLSTRQKRNVLAKECGYYQMSVGTILNQNCTENQKQELKVRSVTLGQLVTLNNSTRCSKVGLNNYYSCAEFLGIGVETLKNVITYYRQKYGTAYFYKGRIFEFRDYSVMVLNTGLTQETWNEINEDSVPCLKVFQKIQKHFLYRWLICPTLNIRLGTSMRTNTNNGQNPIN